MIHFRDSWFHSNKEDGIQTKQIRVATILFLFVMLVGTLGYYVIGRGAWEVFDCFYMTVITLSTVGYEEVLDLEGNTLGKVFTVCILFVGMGSLLYLISAVTAMIVEGQLGEALRRKKMRETIGKLKDHFIVCGIGDTGLHVVKELKGSGKSFVVIEINPERLIPIQEDVPDLLFIQGDATEEALLLAAGLENAAGVVTCLPNDNDNLMVTFTVSQINPTARIVSRAMDLKNISKLERAGADVVVSPNILGGRRMSNALLHPEMLHFFDDVLRDAKQHIRYEEIGILKGSHLDGKTLRDAAIPQKTGLLVLACRDRNTSSLIYNPPVTLTLSSDHTLIVMGKSEAVEKLKHLVL